MKDWTRKMGFSLLGALLLAIAFFLLIYFCDYTLKPITLLYLVIYVLLSVLAWQCWKKAKLFKRKGNQILEQSNPTPESKQSKLEEPTQTRGLTQSEDSKQILELKQSEEQSKSEVKFAQQRFKQEQSQPKSILLKLRPEIYITIPLTVDISNSFV